ncbi:unnamed protein product [Rangifer tarandus platyrhynchus]|uniref:Uncharacterized protein n=2 Tax=Rangifer tarandus platyrhynchus TaxID=3082113 RepID=A0ABN8ZC50_RANTA|nr:unnamed protein product [Rangifer tarandus platyrhynchus]
MSHSVSRGLSVLTYPRVFSKPDPPQSEKTQPEGTGLQGLCAKPSQESRPGVPQARPAEGASPQKKRRCLPGTELPWSPALSPSFTRTASRGTHLERARLALRARSSPSAHCSWAVCFQCPGTAFPTVSRGGGVPAYVLPWASGRGVGWQGLRGREGLPVSCDSSTRSSLWSLSRDCVLGIGREGTDIMRLLWQGLGSSVTCPLTPLPPPATCMRESGVFTYPHFPKSLL